MSAQDRIARLTKQLSHSEQEELCKYIQSQYCVDDDSFCDEYIEKMAIEAVKKMVKIIVSKVYNVNDTDIRLNTKLDNMRLDSSCSRAEVAVSLEKLFTIKFSDSEHKKWETINDIADSTNIK